METLWKIWREDKEVLRIGICEDDKTQKEYLVKEIETYYQGIGSCVQVSAFESAEELLFHYPLIQQMWMEQ